MKYLIKLVILTLFVGPARAGEFFCEGVFTQAPSLRVEIALVHSTSAEPAFIKKSFAQVQKLYPAEIQRMGDVLAETLSVRAQVPLKIHEGAQFNDHLDMATGLIDVGSIYGKFRMDQANKKVVSFYKNPQEMLPLIRHEFGHDILMINLRKDFPEIDRFLTAQENLANFKTQHQADLGKLNQLQAIFASVQKGIRKMSEADFLDLQNSIVAFTELKNKNDELVMTIAAFTEVKNRVLLFTPYNEFFADAVSTLFANGEPNAVRDALKVTMPPPPSGSVFEDVTLKTSGRQNKTAVLGAVENSLRAFDAHIVRGTEATTAHGVFWQARLFLWRNYYKRPSLYAKKAQVAQAIYLVMADAYRLLRTNPVSIMKNQDDCNRQLIEALRQRLDLIP